MRTTRRARPGKRGNNRTDLSSKRARAGTCTPAREGAYGKITDITDITDAHTDPDRVAASLRAAVTCEEKLSVARA